MAPRRGPRAELPTLLWKAEAAVHLVEEEAAQPKEEAAHEELQLELECPLPNLGPAASQLWPRRKAWEVDPRWVPKNAHPTLLVNSPEQGEEQELQIQESQEQGASMGLLLHLLR